MKRISPILSMLLRVCLLLSFLTACNASYATPPQTPEAVALDAPTEINTPLIESPSLIQIRFLNERDGWGITETQVVRTNDGGVTWHNVTPPEVTETGYSVDWFVLDNDHVWIQQPDNANYPFAGFQYRTIDGGIHWNKIDVPFSDARVSFLDSNNGWALADLGIGAGSNAVAVYQTTDGGATWIQKFINDPNHANASESLPLGGLKYGLVPLNMQTAWIFGVIYAPGTPYLFRTDDGGATWSSVNLPLPTGSENADVGIEQMFVASVDIMYLKLRAFSDTSNLVIYVSSDAGNTWSLTPTLIPGGGDADFLPDGEMIVYNREQFYVTRDAAKTWSILPPDIKFGDSFSRMDFVNADTGYVISQDPTTNHRSLYRTEDGGITWFPIIP